MSGPTALASMSPELRRYEEMSIEELLTVEVTTASGGKAQTRALAAANVQSVTSEEIASRGWRSLQEVLQNSLGVYVVDDLTQPSVSVRGVSGGLRGGTRIMKVMVNGVAVNFRPDLTAPLGPEFIPMEAVDRVEIAKGPLSALYGANAFLAVVNVITHKPTEDGGVTLAARSTVTNGRVGFGASGMASYSAEGRGLLVSASVDRMDRSGLSVAQTFASQDPASPRYQNFFGQRSEGDLALPASAYAQLRLEGEKTGVFVLQGGLQQQDNTSEFQLNSVLTHRSRVQLTNVWSSASYEQRLGDSVTAQGSLGLSHGTYGRDTKLYLTGNEGSFFRPNASYTALDGAAKLTLTPWERLSVDIGVDGAIEKQVALFYTETALVPQGALNAGDSIDRIGASDTRRFTLSNMGAFAQLTTQPLEALPDLHVTGNVRVDVPNLFPAQLSWRLAGAYQWSKDFTTKLIMGSAFQSPSGALLYGLSGFGSANNVIGARTLPGLRALNPQTVQSAELLTIGNVANVLALEGGLYVQQVLNRIEFVQAGANFRAENQGTQRNMGAELKARALLGRFSPYLNVNAQRSLLNDVASALPPPLYPNLFGQAGLDVDAPELFLRLNAQVRYASERGATQSNVLLNNRVAYTLPSYAAVDVSVSSMGMRLLHPVEETRLRVVALNVLNARYAEPGFGGIDLPNVGRTVRLELEQSF